ncbi:MAG TPA: carboxymuconolactone decarboxylase family protein [Dehalococcoidia bacterium]|nr:carboxymuconolactone decarboxylase family protein [Dehalococcoidia bacterium]
MPRLRQVPRAEATPAVLPMYDRLFGQRDPVAEPGTATGTPGNWWTVMAQSPEIFQSFVGQFGLIGSKSRVLPPRFRELGITRTGFAAGSRFVFSQHCKACRSVGITEEQIADLPVWASSAQFDAADRAVLAYTDELVLADGRVQDATFARLKALLSDEAILELTFIVCTYRLHATMCRALRLEYDDVPERVAEIPAPAPGAAAADIMRQISRE